MSPHGARVDGRDPLAGLRVVFEQLAFGLFTGASRQNFAEELLLEALRPALVGC